MSELLIENRHSATTELNQNVYLSLNGSGYREIESGVQATIEEGIVTLTGNVPRFHHAQVALSRVMSVPGVHRIVNKIKVMHSGS